MADNENTSDWQKKQLAAMKRQTDIRAGYDRVMQANEDAGINRGDLGAFDEETERQTGHPHFREVFWASRTGEPGLAPLPDTSFESMSDASAAESAAETAAIPPPTEVPTGKPASIKLPPPATAMLASMGETAAKELNTTKAGQPKRYTAKMKRMGMQDPAGVEENPFPQFKAVPPPQLDVMGEMADGAKGVAGEGKKAAPVAMPAMDVERIAAPGEEQARIMQQRAAATLEAIDRVFDAQNKVLEKALGMLAAHEQKLFDLDGFLERSRR